MQDEKRFIHLYTAFALVMGAAIIYASFLAGIAQPESSGYMAASIGKKTVPAIELAGIDAQAGRIVVRNNMGSPIIKANARLNGKWTLGMAVQIMPGEFGAIDVGSTIPEQDNLKIAVFTADGNAGELETYYDLTRV